jgi:glycerol kinase
MEGSIFAAGAVVKWLRDQVGMLQTAAETEALANSVADNGGVYLVPAFTGLAAPHWRSDLRATISGLTLGSNKAHIARAALEAVVYQTADLLAAMKADGAVIENLQIDGGMVNNHWFCQFLADVLDLQVMRPLQTETTAFGVALLAGIQLKWYDDLAALPSLVRAESWFRPQMSENNRRELLLGWHQAVQRLLAADH